MITNIKEVIEIRCGHCGKIDSVNYNGRWTTEDGDIYRLHQCTKCGIATIVSRDAFKENKHG